MLKELQTLERRLRHDAAQRGLVLTKVRSRQPYIGHPKYLLRDAYSGDVVTYTCEWGPDAVRDLLIQVAKLTPR